MIGIELDISAADVFRTAMDRGLLVCYAQEKILRLAPPLTIDDAGLAEGMEILLQVLRG